MSSFLWLLLYLVPLLGLTAALFAWFGWQWRGSDMQQRIQELTTQIDAAQSALRHAETEHAASHSKTTPAEDNAQHEQASRELQALQDGLQSAHTEARQRKDEAAKAHEAALALETEMARLLDDLEQLRAERAEAQAELASLRSTQSASDVVSSVETSLSGKPKRKRSTPAKSKSPADAATASLREIITALENQLAAHQAGISTLIQERDDWQRRISKLEGMIPADPAGLGLARRSFADSEKRLVTATTEIERLQNQTRVLLRVEEQTAALTEVPDDDLTQIKGIKKVISEQLRAHGIRTWRQIALWNEDEQRAFSELLAFKNRATREQWQEQARALHEAAHGFLL